MGCTTHQLDLLATYCTVQHIGSWHGPLLVGGHAFNLVRKGRTEVAQRTSLPPTYRHRIAPLFEVGTWRNDITSQQK